MSTWRETALRAAHDHEQREQDADEQDAAETLAYVQRLTEQLGVRATAGTARFGERFEVEGATVMVYLPSEPSRPDVRLVAMVDHDAKPQVWAEVQEHTGAWADRGHVETLIDLGRALDPTHTPDAGQDEAPESVGDLLLSVLQGIVRDVVHDELDGRLGDGRT